VQETVATNRIAESFSEYLAVDSRAARKRSQLGADCEAAVGCIRSWRNAQSGGSENSKPAPLRDNETDLSHFLDTLSLDSAVLWLESDRSLGGMNRNAQTWLGIDLTRLGHRFEFEFNRTASRLDALSDQMLQIGAPTAQYEFDASQADGDWYRWVIRKTRLPGLYSAGFGCLVIALPLLPVLPNDLSSLAILEEQLAHFESLDEIDRTICQGIALGDTTSEIARSVGLARRSVEVRRGKILEHFGFSRTVQIVRMMVRFEENGCFGT
jgi:hypothetical protein